MNNIRISLLIFYLFWCALSFSQEAFSGERDSFGRRTGFWAEDYESFHFPYTIMSMGNYSAGIREGEWKEYIDGNLTYGVRYTNGQLEDSAFAYYPNGRLIFKVIFVNNSVNGLVYHYDEKQRLIALYTCENDSIIKIRKYKGYKKYTKNNFGPLLELGESSVTFSLFGTGSLVHWRRLLFLSELDPVSRMYRN